MDQTSAALHNILTRLQVSGPSARYVGELNGLQKVLQHILLARSRRRTLGPHVLGGHIGIVVAVRTPAIWARRRHPPLGILWVATGVHAVDSCWARVEMHKLKYITRQAILAVSTRFSALDNMHERGFFWAGTNQAV